MRTLQLVVLAAAAVAVPAFAQTAAPAPAAAPAAKAPAAAPAVVKTPAGGTVKAVQPGLFEVAGPRVNEVMGAGIQKITAALGRQLLRLAEEREAGSVHDHDRHAGRRRDDHRAGIQRGQQGRLPGLDRDGGQVRDRPYQRQQALDGRLGPLTATEAPTAVQRSRMGKAIAKPPVRAGGFALPPGANGRRHGISYCFSNDN